MKKNMIYGAIAGDVAGSTYEFYGMTGAEKDFIPQGSKFTDDTVLTVAAAYAILKNMPFAETYKKFGLLYPNPKGGYGTHFHTWLMKCHFNKEIAPAYNSYGNGSAMRVSPCAYAAQTLEEAVVLARKSAECTHNHPEGIKGAEATAAAIFLALHGKSKEEIKKYIHENYYNMNRSKDDLCNAPYTFNAYCQNTVPEAILCFLYSDDYESAVRLAMLTNKDCDTAAAICGAIAGAYYGVSDELKDKVRTLLDDKLISVLDEFEKKYIK